MRSILAFLALSFALAEISPLLASGGASPSMSTAHQAGQAHANALQRGVIEAARSTNPNTVPGFQTESPPEASLRGNLGDIATRELTSSSAGQTILQTSRTRQRYRIDPTTDPLFRAEINEEAFIGEREQGRQEETTRPLTCEEGGEEVDYECSKDLQVDPQVPLKRVRITIDYPELVRRVGVWRDGIGQLPVSTRDYDVNPTVFRQNVCPVFEARDALTGQVFNLDCLRVQRYWVRSIPSQQRVWVTDRYGARSNPVRYIAMEFEHDTYEEGDGREQWASNCDSLEDLVDEGLCRYGEKVCTQGPQTRTINGYKIHKDCWQYKQTYHCKMIKYECSALRAQGCHQIASRCKEQRQGRCWIYEQTYQCPNGRLTLPHFSSSPLQPFCITGNCVDKSYEANGELLEVVSRLSILREVQEDIRGQQQNLSHASFEIFKGEDKRCSRNCISFKDCCGGMKGWGTALGFARCSADERQLSFLRKQGLCHQIGTYCSKRILGVCVSKKTTFCCFGTKFARLLQEQGRPQLGIGWGEPRSPVCRGFTVEELSHIDFSHLNLQEVFEEVMAKYKSPNVGALQEATTQKIQDNLSQIERGLRSPTLQKGVLGNVQNGL